MRILSYNVRGLGGRVKRKVIKKLIQKEEVDVVCIQESKLSKLDLRMGGEMWGDKEVEWREVEAVNNAGGVITMWGRGNLQINDVFLGNNVVGIKGMWKEEMYDTAIVNVYSPCNMAGKRALWDELLDLRNSWGDGVWVVTGDFNAVRKKKERMGRNSTNGSASNIEIAEFNNFIDAMRLQDLPMIGQLFTWYKAGGGAKSRIDRILMSQEWLQLRPMSAQYTICREISDHYPIILKYNQQNWGPKPFKICNAWMLEPGFQRWAEEEYKKIQVQGWGAFVLREKLKQLKRKIKEWVIQNCGRLNMEEQEVVRKINVLDSKDDLGNLSLSEAQLREEEISRYWEIARKQEAALFYKSRFKWIKDGDENSRYFHSIINWRRKINSVRGMNINGLWVEDPTMVKEEIKRFFENRFKGESGEKSISFEGLEFNKLNETQAAKLIEKFSEQEIKEAVWDCEGSKSPGPNGYNFSFIKAAGVL